LGVETGRNCDVQGVEIDTWGFPISYKVPHASIDPFTDEAIREMVYARILKWLGVAPTQ